MNLAELKAEVLKELESGKFKNGELDLYRRWIALLEKMPKREPENENTNAQRDTGYANTGERGGDEGGKLP